MFCLGSDLLCAAAGGLPVNEREAINSVKRVLQAILPASKPRPIPPSGFFPAFGSKPLTLTSTRAKAKAGTAETKADDSADADASADAGAGPYGG